MVARCCPNKMMYTLIASGAFSISMLCMYVYMYMYICIYVYMYITYKYEYIYIYTYVCMIYIYINLYVYIYIIQSCLKGIYRGNENNPFGDTPMSCSTPTEPAECDSHHEEHLC